MPKSLVVDPQEVRKPEKIKIESTNLSIKKRNYWPLEYWEKNKYYHYSRRRLLLLGRECQKPKLFRACQYSALEFPFLLGE